MGAISAGVAALIGWGIVGGVAAGIMSGTKKKSTGGAAPVPTPMPMPQAPAQEDVSGQAEEAARRRRRRKTRTVFTNPLGIGGQADVARKTLLGL